MTKPVLTYGIGEDAMVRAEAIEHDGGRMRFRALRKDAQPLDVVLNLPGATTCSTRSRRSRSARELGVAGRGDREGAGANSTASAGASSATARCSSTRGGAAFTLIDDYGHHPAEMAATLEAARGAFPGRRLVLAFQPHRYTRTRDLFEDFVRVLSTVDALVLAEVYAAGEAPIVAADGRALARAVRVAGKVEPVFVEDIARLPEAIRRAARDGDVVITMGAGSIGGVPAQLATQMT